MAECSNHQGSIRDHAAQEGPLCQFCIAFRRNTGSFRAMWCRCLNITRAEVHGVISFILIFAKRPRTGISSRFAALRYHATVGSRCCHNALETRR
jgi:hypothetical protein